MLTKSISIVLSLILLPSLGFASDRFGESSRYVSYTVYGAYNMVSGDRGELATRSFLSSQKSRDLYSDSKSFGIEYAETTGKLTLATAILYTSARPKSALNTNIELSPNTPLSVTYFDAPVTLRVSALDPGRSLWNLTCGIGLCALVDITKSSEPVFESSEGGETTAESGSNKHVDFGIGFNGDIGVEYKFPGNLSAILQVGFVAPISGVTRPDVGFARVGIRLYEM